MDLTVVGNGVAGSALARLARADGLSVKVVGGPPSASLAALAVLKLSYLAAEPDAAEAIAFALEQYRDAGCQVIEGAWVSSKQKPEPVRQADWWAIDPTPYLVQPDFTGKVSAGWRDPQSDVTIHATGAAGIEGKLTYGVTWYNAAHWALKVDGMAVHRFAPYKSADAVRYRNGCRLGSSSSKTLAGARTEAGRIFDEAKQQGWIGTDSGWVAIVGTRVQRERLVENLNDDGTLFSFGGFHRSGWSLAPIRAKQLLDELLARK